jgi:uncharacterized protein (DUF302 family)
MTTDSSTGIVKFTSPWPYRETVERIEAALLAKKIKLFANIDQSAEAAAVLRCFSLRNGNRMREGLGCEMG